MAIERRISLSTLINTIMERHLDIDLPASKAGYAYFSKKLLAELTSQVSEEAITSLATNIVAPELINFTYMMKNKLDSESLLHSLLKLAEFSGYDYSIVHESGIRKILFHPDMGIRYNQLMRKSLECSFREAGNPTAQVEMPSQDLVMIKLD